MICDKCNGNGCILNEDKNELSYLYKVCSKCKGNGELDWLENVFGVQINSLSYKEDFISSLKHCIEQSDWYVNMKIKLKRKKE